MNILRAIVVALILAAASPRALAENYSDMWWNPNESGWGLIIIDHDTDLFVVWCTYEANGRATWNVIPGGKFSFNRTLFEGDLYSTQAMGDFDSAWTEVTLVGAASIEFGVDSDIFPPGFAAFSLRRVGAPVRAVETHYVKRQPFGSGQGSWAAGGTDMWWNPGWPGSGLATIQHGNDDMFAVWLTYATGGLPTFYVIPSRRNERQFPPTVSHQFAGTVYKTQARAGDSTFDPASVSALNVGPASMTFYDDTSRMELFLPPGIGSAVPLSRLPFGAVSPQSPAASPGSR